MAPFFNILQQLQLLAVLGVCHCTIIVDTGVKALPCFNKEYLLQSTHYNVGTGLSMMERESAFSACDTDRTNEVTWTEVELCEVS